MADNQKYERRRKSASNVIQAQQAKENAQKHGEAAFQFVDGYFGDAATGKKGLRDIKGYKTTEARNVEQQAGFSAEIYYTSEQNANNILAGKRERVVRTDDIGQVNNPRADHVTVDGNGKVTGQSQMKFRGDSANAALGAKDNVKKLMTEKEWAKYGDGDITLPSEQVPHAKAYAASEAAKLRKQAEHLRKSGRGDEALKKEARAERYDDLSERMKDSGITREKAVKLRKNPESVVLKDTLRTAHEGGVKQAKTGAMLAGGISAAQNVAAVAKGEKSVGAAAIDTAVDTAKGAAVSYVTTTGASLLKVGLQEAGKRSATQGSKQVFTALGKGNTPALIVTSTLEVGKSVKRYLDGELDAKGLVAELGEKGTGIVASTFGAELGGVIGTAVGTMIFPGVGTAIGAVAGAVIGSMVGYMVGTQLYQSTLQFLALPLEAEKWRLIKEMCDQAREIMERERLELVLLYAAHFASRQVQLLGHFESIRESILANDSQAIISRLGNIAVLFGGTLGFKNFEEFDAFMLDPDLVFEL